MSVLVKGIEMPKNCYDCSFIQASVAGYFYCVAGDGIEENLKKLYEHRMSDCPLVEVKEPHGRLGDLDALYEEISNGNKAYNGIEGYDGEYPNIANVDDCLDAIKYAETVIEAEGREE